MRGWNCRALLVTCTEQVGCLFSKPTFPDLYREGPFKVWQKIIINNNNKLKK